MLKRMETKLSFDPTSLKDRILRSVNLQMGEKKKNGRRKWINMEIGYLYQFGKGGFTAKRVSCPVSDPLGFFTRERGCSLFLTTFPRAPFLLQVFWKQGPIFIPLCDEPFAPFQPTGTSVLVTLIPDWSFDGGYLE